MKLSKPLMLKTQLFQQQFGKPFYDDFQTFYSECFEEAQAYVLDKCFDKVCEYYGIWKDLDAWNEVLDIADTVLADMKFNAQQEYNRIKNETDDIDYDPNEHQYIQIDVPNEKDIFDDYIDYCEDEGVWEKIDDEVCHDVCKMTSEVYSDEVTDLEDEYIYGQVMDDFGGNPDEIMEIDRNHDLAKLESLVNKWLEEYRQNN